MSLHSMFKSKRLARPITLLALVAFIVLSTIFLVSQRPSCPRCLVADPPPHEELKAKRLSRYSDLAVLSAVEGPWDDRKADLVRMLVGSLHRYRSGNGAVPSVHVFYEHMPPTVFCEEAAMWQRFHLESLQEGIGVAVAMDGGSRQAVRRALIGTVLEHDGSVSEAVFVKLGLIYDPMPGAVKSALGKSGTIGNSPSIIKPVFRRAREFVHLLMDRIESDGLVEGWSDSGKELLLVGAGRQQAAGSGQRLRASDFGFVPKPMYADAGCYMDIRFDVIGNSAMMRDADSLPSPAVQAGKRFLVIGLPLTSKGAGSDQEPVVLKALLPSLMKTISDAELEKFHIAIYIAYDRGDPLWDDDGKRRVLREKIGAICPFPVRMFRMANMKRVAMLWSMLYTKAISDGADFFFQVNDDLTVETAGWLDHYSRLLDSNNGFGVAGPYDPHNSINCAVLTQAMVSKVHFSIFGTLYPVEMKDWKTDRWLTHVYRIDGFGNFTHCSPEFVARNGAAKTRYKYCEFLSWQIYMEEGRERIKSWLRDNKL